MVDEPSAVEVIEVLILNDVDDRRGWSLRQQFSELLFGLGGGIKAGSLDVIVPSLARIAPFIACRVDTVV